MFDPSMFGKLSQMKQLADESRKKLDNQFVEGESGNGLIIIRLNGNREFQNLTINTDHTLMTKDDLEDLFSIALKRALEAAEELNQRETMQAAQTMFNGIK
jgi:DNA-binding protein YbaB